MGKTANYPLPIKTVHTIIVLWIQLILMRPGAQSRLILMEFMSMALVIMDSAQMTAKDARITMSSSTLIINLFAKVSYSFDIYT